MNIEYKSIALIALDCPKFFEKDMDNMLPII